MYKAFLIYILTFFLLPILLYSGETPALSFAASGSIAGTVVNEEGEALPGSTVMLDHRSIGAYSNAKGEFFIKYAPVGEFTLKASMVGFHPDSREVAVQTGDTVFINFTLKQAAFNTGTVVVTATSTPHTLEDSPIHTEVISSKTIERKHANSLAEALDGHTGVLVENNCSNCNFSQVRINGLDGKYSEILIDGDPVFSTLAGVYGLEQIPEDMISNIEIVKGSGSSLYGGGAVAGVINVITRKPVANRMKVKYLANTFTGKNDDNRSENFDGDQTMEHNVSAIAEFISQDGSAGGYVFGSARTRNPYDRNGDGYSELGIIKSESFGVNSYFDINPGQELTINFHHIHENRRGGNDYDIPFHEADICEAAETWRWGGKVAFNHRVNEIINYKAYYSAGLTDRHTYYGGTGGDNSDEGKLAALNAYGKTHNPLHLFGVRSHVEYGKQIITFGADYKLESIEDGSVRNIENKLSHDYKNFGIYIQDNLHFLKDESLELVVGARADKHSELVNFVFSPRLSVKYALDYGFNLRASYSSGFKAPQIFDEDLHIESMEGKQRRIRNADNLKEEKSNSFTVGAEYNDFIGDMPFFFNTTGFYTQLTNAFDTEFDFEDDRFFQYLRVNAGDATVTGFEFNTGLRPVNCLEIRLGLNYKKAEYGEANPDFGDQEGAKVFKRTPDLSANISIDYDISNDFVLLFMGKYLGSAYLPHESLMDEVTEIIPLVKTDSYFVLDIGAQYEFSVRQWTLMKLSFGVKNILDSYQQDLDWGVDRDPAYLYGPSLPRTFYIGMDFEI